MAFHKVLLLFSPYTTPLSTIIHLHPHIKFHFYVDDTQLYIHLSHKNASSALAKLNACLYDVQRWMSLSKLKLNPKKTVFIVFGSKAQHHKISSHFPVSILGSLLHMVDSVRNLGVWFDAVLSQSLLQMPWLVVVWTIVTLCSEICQVLLSTNCKVFRTPLLVLLQVIESMLMLHPF